MSAAGTMPFSVADLRHRVARMSTVEESDFACFGDHRLNPDMISELAARRLRNAAVLVPVVDDDEGEARVILTRRTTSLRRHSGQIALPGGAVDPGDASVEAAALREAHEEIGLDPGHVEPIGRLPVYLVATGFRITPVVAVVRPGFSIRMNPAEVDAVFEVPLSFLMSEANHRRGSRDWDGRTRHFYTMPYQDWFIWGVTAGILRTLYERAYA